MSEKNIENTQNTANEKKELTPAERILEKIKQKKEGISQSEPVKEEVKTEAVEKLEGKVEETSKNEVIEEKVEDKVEETSVNEVIEEEKENIKDLISAEETNSEISEEDIKKEIKEIKPKEEKAVEEDEVVDYTTKTKEELISLFGDLLTNDNTSKYNKKVKSIRNEFYKKINTEEAERKAKFLENDGNKDDYEPLKDELETKFKDLFNKYIDKKEAWELKLKEEKKNNLALKYGVIKEIEELINKPETFNKTFNKFKDLQKKWTKIGLVPKDNVKALFDDYNHQVHKFYEYTEVNKQLRELDFKKNLDVKIKLCEKAEELSLESNYSKAKKELQNLHKKWKETGSVSNENREVLWTRFQAATIKINDKFSEYIEEVKIQQEKNLESKRFLVQAAKEYATEEYTGHKEWKDASNKIIELQNMWRRIGYVPKEFNNEIYKEFKTTCDSFFARIREFYDESDKNRDDNYQKKLDLCVQAESLQDSNEWNNTTEIYKQIQQDWKKIGPVSRKQSDVIWKRFRKACNIFFDRKKEHFMGKKNEEKENLEAKQEVIKKIENYKFTDNQIEDLKGLKELQNEFMQIGYVPFKDKDAIYDQYHEAIDNQLDVLNVSKDKLNELKFSENLEIIKNSPSSDKLVYNEMSRLQKQIDKLSDDIKVWDNNIGFFASSKNSEVMINNIKDKIKFTREKVAKLKNQMDELSKISE